jgi:DNA-binding beta-propeller fold protein YncE
MRKNGRREFFLAATRTGRNEFNYTYQVACGADNLIYATDFGNDRVQVFTLHGTFQRRWVSEGSGDGEFLCPSGICI